MYQLKIYDEEVCTRIGFIVPNQIYILSYPIEWQLQYLLLKDNYNNTDVSKQLLLKVKFRSFASVKYNRLNILKGLISNLKNYILEDA
ncbi:hypothetical protein [Staphylococcus saccharolyticus]|uniref:Transcription factor n=1 Tax=Staphylococcus saccharolyticus TaxID=33028 RepID=A0A380H6A0_9STAP|nr:hypothetical protein [Staphylococcus saccharolyticus]SUM73238.1 transcription factor [Staphylococcus saccharolyticus]